MKVTALVLASAFALAGCNGGGLSLGSRSATGSVTSVQGGAVRIAPPRGYCLDESTLQTSATGDFLLFGTCKGLGAIGPKAPFPAVLTAAVAPGAGTLNPSQMEALATFLKSPDGRRALSRTDSGADVQVTQVQRTADLILVSARDGATGDLAPDYWRGIFTLADTLVTVTVSGTRAAPLSNTDGRALIVDFIAATRGANAPASEAPADATEDTARVAKGLGALFNRLL